MNDPIVILIIVIYFLCRTHNMKKRIRKLEENQQYDIDGRSYTQKENK